MKEEIVRIEKIIFGGEGLSRLQSGKVVFVPYVIPGELVRIGIKEEYKDYAEAELLEIIEPAPDRESPPCRYYGICGGCHFQHLSYREEIKIKENMLRELFQRHTQKSEIPLKKVYPSPLDYQYRNRLRLHIENSSLKMGFVKRKSHEVIKIEKCIISHPLINKLLEELYSSASWLNLSLYSKRVKLEVSLLENKVTLLFWTLVEPKRENLMELLELQTLKSLFYLMRGSRPKGPYPEEATFGGRKLLPAPFNLTYYIQPGVFTQTNWEVNLAIMEKVLELSVGAERVLDLHSGMGNFILPLVKKLSSAKEFLGVDTDSLAIEDAFYTAEKNSLNSKLDFRKMSAMEALHQAISEGKKYDLILLDPPRGGCRELLKLLPEVAQDRIIYLSCDAPTLVRDIAILEKLGFTLAEVYLFDMFPRTYHFESLALLQRRA